MCFILLLCIFVCADTIIVCLNSELLTETRWTKLYQKPLQQPDQALEEGKLELMVRPPFPPFFRKSQPPKFCPTSDVIAITNDTWKVGDLVDWWYDSCYWSGRVSELLKDDHIKVNVASLSLSILFILHYIRNYIRWRTLAHLYLNCTSLDYHVIAIGKLFCFHSVT